MINENPSEQVTFSGNTPSETCFSGGGKCTMAPASAIKNELEMIISKNNRFNNLPMYYLRIPTYLLSEIIS